MRERFRRRRLPHWDKPGAIYFVTSCLSGSIPATGLRELHDLRKQFVQPITSQSAARSVSAIRQWKQMFSTAESWLDRRPAVSHLADDRLAKEVAASLLHFAGERYALWAFVVMPSHFHWVFEPLPSWVAFLGPTAEDRTPRERIMQSAKRHSAYECNRLLGAQGAFWQDESYDHCVEDPEELARVISYTEQNPVKAGLCTTPDDWCCSSARCRREHSVPWGRPIIGTSQMFGL